MTYALGSAEYAMTAAPAIETTGLSRDFGDIRAVDELSLHVPRCSVYAFLGLNGAGKTTTIRMLLGLTHTPIMARFASSVSR